MDCKGAKQARLLPKSIHRSGLHCLLARQQKPLFRRSTPKHHISNVGSYRGPVLESMARTTAHQPNVFEIRMAVNEKVTVPRVFILAHPRFQNWGVGKARDMLAEERPQASDGFCRNDSLLGIRINGRAVPVKGNFVAVTLNFRQSIRNVWVLMVQPYRHSGRPKTVVSRRRPEEEDLLPRGEDKIFQQRREHLGQPGATSKNKMAAGDRFSVRRFDV